MPQTMTGEAPSPAVSGGHGPNNRVVQFDRHGRSS